MTITFRPVDAHTDADLLHSWFTQDRARFWGMLDATVEDVRAAHAAISASPHHEAYLGSVDDAPAFLMERYDPEHHPVGAHYPVSPGDIGMHLLVAGAATPIAGFTHTVMNSVLEFLFGDPAVQRIVVKPDVQNEKIHALNARVGFEKSAVIALDDKRAWLSFCTRTQFAARGARARTIRHLSPERWAAATRHLVRKAIAEFSHERLLRSAKHGTGFELAAGDPDPTVFSQLVERSMTEGHPCFVANNGRLGFGASDYLDYAPETGARVRLVWLAVTRDRAVFSASTSRKEHEHFLAELGETTLTRFWARLRARGLDPDDYLLLPVHPWQWENKLTVTFAADIAAQQIVHLGTGDDRYQAQQSIRTFFNVDAPERCYVKTALSVLNMGFMRGLSAEYMKSTPTINDWLGELVAADPSLTRAGFSILREVAAVGYHNHYYEAASPPGSPYRKMLSALWRESPLDQLDRGQEIVTMASLLHQDHTGRPFVSALIDRSGLPAADWLRSYLRAYLVPLVHCLYAYELAFMPHGENVILVLENGVPVRMIMKDIGEEIAVMGSRLALPDDVARIRVNVPPAEQVLTIFTDVFDCFFRFLAATLADDCRLDENSFWGAVADTITDYQAETPGLAAKFAQQDLFAPEFPLSCLNRLQLRNNKHMLDLTDPSWSLQISGTLTNPIARFRA